MVARDVVGADIVVGVPSAVSSVSLSVVEMMAWCGILGSTFVGVERCVGDPRAALVV